MNNERRKRISEEIENLQNAMQNLEVLRDEEQECYDNLPESFQDGERGEKMTECIDALDNAISNIEDVIAELQECIE